MIDLRDRSIRDLLAPYGEIGIELKRRGVGRTSNNPVGDIAEHLLGRTFGWTLERNSRAGFDARCAVRDRIEIKSRFLRKPSHSRQAGAIRQLKERHFDWLAGIVFSPDCGIDFAFLAPYPAILERARDTPHTNSHRIFLKRDWLHYRGVEDVTADVAKHWETLVA